MLYNCGKISDINIAYIGGGSKSWARVLMGDLALEEQLSGTVRLYDIDYQAAYENQLIGNHLWEKNDVLGKWKYETVRTFKEALTSADFVIISILPGTFKEMASDVHTPEKYGIYQSVGDTVGPGGFMRALRTIPMFMEFADNIRQYSPNAWVINYTNPMSICTRTLYYRFPEIKAFGCCHEVYDTKLDIADMLKRFRGIKVENAGDIKTNILGINHFTWFDEISWKGIDLMPLYKEVTDDYYEDGFVREDNKHWKNNVYTSANRVKFDLFKRYGLIAAAGDRHLAEFMPPWYLKNPKTISSWKFSLTTVDWRVEESKELEELSKRLISGEEEFQLKPSGEEGVLQIKAILGLGDLVTNVNLPNHGQMKDIPFSSVVETNALFSKGSVKPVFAGILPHDIQNLVLRHIYNQESIIQASLNKDRQFAFNTFVNDPLVSVLDVHEAEKLFDEMINNTKEYLPGW